MFRGRASRSEFWWWTLAAVIINALLSLLGDVTDGRLDFLTSLWNLAIVVPGLALAVRRLHDTNKPGWWVAVFCGMMTLGLLIMIIGGGAALYGAVQEPLATVMTMVMATAMRLWQPAVFGAAVIGAIDHAGRLRLSISCSWLFPASRRAHGLTMARRSTPHASGRLRRAVQHACTPESCSAAPGFPAPGTPAQDFGQTVPTYGQNPQYGQTPQYAPAPQYGQVPPEHENAGPDSGETR